MPSRRKQVRPIKASCQSIDISSNQNQYLLSKDQPNLQSWDESPKFSEPVFLEANEEPVKDSNPSNVDETTDIGQDPHSLPITSLVIDRNVENINNIQSNMDKTIDEISKKMNKDEAKILPFQSSGGVDFFKCPLCDLSYICGRESLTVHLQEHQNKMKRDDGKHLCCLCSKELSSNSSLERHLLTHSNHRPFSCLMCDKKFTTNGNLSRHIKTSHNNNETIESSIDEVLKKHQIEPENRAPFTPVGNNKSSKYKKPFKMSRKDFKITSDNNTKPETKLNDSIIVQPCSRIEEQIVQEPIFKAIFPANTIFPPLLSLNIKDLSFLKNHQSEKFSFLPTNSISLLTNMTQKIDDKKPNQCPIKIKRDHLKSQSLLKQWKTRKYLEKLSLHLRRTRKAKKNVLNSKIKCWKCCRQIVWQHSDIISHVRKCYSTSSTEPKYCLFKYCCKKFYSKRNLINHIKIAHNIFSSSKTLQIPSNNEPLNLSIKTPKITNSSEMSMPQFIQTNTNGPIVDNFEKINVCPTYSSSLCNDSINAAADFSTNSFPWNFQKLIFPQALTNNSQLSTFTTKNQFISSPSFVTTTPLSLPNSFKNDFDNFNKSDFNETSTLNQFSGTFNIQNKANNVSIRGCQNSNTNSSNSRSGGSSITTMSNTNDFSALSPHTENFKLKFSLGIKKKNSYKDAPKLITCPMEGCVQKFPWNSSLMRHILTHTAHKPFKCTRCTKCFSTKSNRERHMTRVHGVRINRSKFRSLQGTKISIEDASKTNEEAGDSENGNLIDETIFQIDKDMNVTELSEEEWIIMDNNDRRAEDISNNLLKLAGQPLVEPNPVRLNNCQISLLDKSLSPKSEYSPKLIQQSKERFYIDNSC